MCTYKSPELFEQRFGRRPDRSGEQPAKSLAGRYDVAGYLDHQGKLFLRRFDANSYILITKAMDNFQLGADAEEEAVALRLIQARVLLVGITSDWLFPPGEVRALAERMQAVGVRALYRELVSMHGHDGFLADGDLLVPHLVAALEEPAYSTTVEPAGLEIPA
jgi:homoserine O-acetyltransferase